MLQSKIENMIQKDKLMHFCAGLLLAQFAYLWIWLLVIPVIVGIAKEIYDRYVRKTGFSWSDLLATVLGSVPVLVMILIMNL